MPVGTAPMTLLEPLLTTDAYQHLGRRSARACALLEGRRVWAVNSAARGGGVAQLLRTLLPYWRGCGIDASWRVVRGTPEFFRVTKRLHHWLHGSRGDGGALGADELGLLDRVGEAHVAALRAEIRLGDVVLLHDPQTASLVAPLKAAGATVVWRCHVGADVPNERVHRAWRSLAPRLAEADAVVFTRPSFVPGELSRIPTHCITPAIDPAGAKNRAMSRREVAGVMGESPLRRLGEAPVVLSLCRWDHLKDPGGILDAFADAVVPRTQARLLLAGPAVGGVEDDPESAEVFADVRTRWEALPPLHRRRVHLLCLPVDDPDRNATMVNALQHAADVVVKKSRAEGFGLGVTEAMWKRRPVVATAVGGQRDQVSDRRSGLLVDDPDDLDRFGAAVVELLRHPELGRSLGRAARERVRSRYLPDRHLAAWTRVFESVVPAA